MIIVFLIFCNVFSFGENEKIACYDAASYSNPNIVGWKADAIQFIKGTSHDQLKAASVVTRESFENLVISHFHSF
jgi:hypothetical protein